MLTRLYCSPDGGATWEPVTVDASGNLQVDVLALPALPAGSNNIGDVDIASITDVANLTKYDGQVLEISYTLTASVGDSSRYSSVVPSGKIWVITAACAINNTSICTSISVGLNNGVTNHHMNRKVSPAVGEGVALLGPMILVEDDKVQATFEGCTAGDDIFLWANGYVVNL